MANNDQDEFGLPTSGNEKRKTSQLLPRTYRTDSNQKFLQATLDQLTQPGKVKKLNGYIGQQNSKSSKASDIYVEAADKIRQNYQLEPGAVIQDKFENVTFFKDYIDYINQLSVFDSDVKNHERLNKQEFYSWDPHINWDKFVNFQNYYWLPYGPDVIKVFGQELEIESTYTIDLVDEDDNYAYLFTPNGLTRNPTIRLYRGQTYNFKINSLGNPFSIKLSRTGGDVERYKKGVSATAVESGVITFKVRQDAPDLLYYVNEKDPTAGGVIQILDIEENTFLDLDKDILGKEDYTLSSGLKLSNGMKLNFEGNVSPEKYKQGNWYVEGVGSSITLVPESALEIISTYTEQSELLFDDTAFDLDPFSVASAYPRDNDYIVMARGSKDRNPWSRYNRWFHEDVIKASATANGIIPDVDQSRRAVRPIIEYEANIKLFNFGHVAKDDVDLIDTFTTDVFSTIEGSLGYNVDGIDLSPGMRVIFTADPDILVKDKIFQVKFVTVTIPQRQIEFLTDSTVNPNTDVITFESDHFLSTGSQVTYLNNGNNNINGLSNRQQYYVYVVSATQIKLFNDSKLTKQVDLLSRGTGIHKFEVFSGRKKQITLVEEPDTTPQHYETVIIKNGLKNKGLTYWYNGNDWKLAQNKTSVNQSIYFDVFDSEGNSYGDTAIYEGSTFTGNKIFSYKEGTGSNDKSLGFPLFYKNINNVGDIVFNFDLLQESFTYKFLTNVRSKRTDIGFLRKVTNLDSWEYVNGWKKTKINNIQPIVRIFKDSGITNNFPVDVYDSTNDLTDLEVRVYVNGKRLNREQYTLERGNVRFSVVLDSDVNLEDIVTLKCFSTQPKNENGYYEIPISLERNPLNNNLTSFTLGEVVDHVSSIVDNIVEFRGAYPGNGNLRDLGDLTAFGSKIVQHSSPLNFPLYHISKSNVNVIKAIVQAQEDYATFKRTFLITAGNTGVELDARRHVDIVLETMLKDKPKTAPYYLSDMFGYTGATRLEYLVEDGRFQRIFSISRDFSLSKLSNQAVYVYRNGEQLTEGVDYVFGNDDVFFNIIGELNDDDIIEVFEFETTDGTFCPPTPTKLGLYPKFKPKKFIDDTYLEPREVIQGHDGSITLAYGDYRDDLLLELELRIFNNIKQSYDSNMFDIYDFIPGYDRLTAYTKDEFERTLSPNFFQWTNNINQDYTKQTYWDKDEPFTFNYRGNYLPNGTDSPAFWRGIYQWLLDTDRPHTHPWECLGFSIEPAWWQEVYGAAPYTKDNQLLWEDLGQGIVREPGKPPRYHLKFARSVLLQSAPVDELGNLISPLFTNYVAGPLPSTATGFYVFGDHGPVETAWRRSSYYPFALLKTILLLSPNQVMSVCFDRSRQIKNNTDQIVYSPTGLRLKLSDIVIPSTVNDTTRIFASGLVNYIVDYATSDITFKIDEYKEDLQSLTNKISHKLGGFTSKNKFNILLDSKNPTSSGGVFVPQDNYNIFLNVSTPIRKLAYSGVVISRFFDGYELRGYNLDEPYFTYYPFRQNDRTIRVGGISESYVIWDANKTYVAGKTVLYNNAYYRTKVTHQAGESFDDSLFARLPGLPIVGGTEAILRRSWDKNQELFLAYGTKLSSIQEVVDFLQGYSVWLEEQGFVFDQYDATLKTVANWETSINEFLFWTTQNWGEGSAVSLSPAAKKLIIQSSKSVVDDIRNSFYGYKIFKVDGQLLPIDSISTFRTDNVFTIQPSNTPHGIYGGIFYLVQKEHVLLLDNTTLFNDVIYDQEPGYRQERVKVLGYITTNWNGSFEIPGFIFDQANIKDYEPWTDYNLGDIVKYKEYYYSAIKFIVGSESFNSQEWTLLREKPLPQLIPNWDYKAEQFTDFYDLDTDNFDREQQRLAQHLIGYQNRQYLENIIKDDVSQYKFYQGMIIEKGTQNVLNKLFDVLSADDQESLTFNEEWAVRVGEYGASNVFEEIEFKLKESEFKINPQPIQLVNEITTNVDLIYRITNGEVYVKPIGFTNNPWPTGGVKKFLRTPGYVRYEDVKLNVNILDDAIVNDISTFEEGDYVWAAFENRDWNVYRFTKNTFSIEDVEYADGTLTLQCDVFPNINVGDIIGIEHSETIKGFYKIDSIVARKIFIKTTIKNWKAPFVDSSQILTYKFISSRLDNIDNANDRLPPYIKNKELLWADVGSKNLSYNGTVPYTVYTNEKVYQRTNLDNTTPLTNLNFGNKVALCKNGKYLAVSTLNNEVYIFEKSLGTETWQQQQYIIPRFPVASTQNLNFGQEIAFSPDGKWLAVAAPTAGFIRSNWKGDFNVSSNYSFGDIIQVRNTHFSAKRSYAGDGSSIDRFNQDWVPAYLVTTEESKAANTNVNQGYVNLYVRTPSGTYGLFHSFVSPNPVSGEKFGSKMTFAKNGSEYVLAITSAGYNSNQGRVYLYRYAELEEDSTVSGWHMDYRRSYQGIFSPGKQYYPGDIVFYNYELYQCITLQEPNSFETNASGWELLDGTSILGYFPQEVVTNDVVDRTPVAITNILPNTPAALPGQKIKRATVIHTALTTPFTAGQYVELRQVVPVDYNGDWLVVSGTSTTTVIECTFPDKLPGVVPPVTHPKYVFDVLKSISAKIMSAALSPVRDITVESVLPGDLFGFDVAMSGDGSKLVISAPVADQNTFTNYRGIFRSSEKYDINDVVYFPGGIVNATGLAATQSYDILTIGTTDYVSIGATPDAKFTAAVRGGTVLGVSRIGFTGKIKLGATLYGTGIIPGTTITDVLSWNISDVVRSSGFTFDVTVTPALPAGLQFASGLRFRISGVSDDRCNGTFTIIGISSNNSFRARSETVFGSGSAGSLGAGGTVNSLLEGEPGFYTISASHSNLILSPATTLSAGKTFVAIGSGTGTGTAFASAGYYRFNITFDSSEAGTFTPADYSLLSTEQFRNTGKIFTYEYDGDAYVLIDTLGSQNLNLAYEERFGDNVTISESGSHLAVSSTLYTEQLSAQGAVKVFEAYSGSWSPYQTLTSITPGTNHKFGYYAGFMNDAETLVVYSPNADIKNETTFDNSDTKFDNATLRIVDLQILSGRVDIFDKYNNNYIFGESLTTNSTNDNTDAYGFSISVGTNHIAVSAPKEEDDDLKDSGIVYTYRKPAGKTSWSVLHYERARPNVYQIKKAFLYNRRENLLVKYLDVVDPIQGKIPGPADQEIKFKTYYDPATYTVGNTGVNVDDGLSWTNTYVGMLWWDLTNAKFLENQGGDLIYRSTTWNTLYETASIDIYEWIESKLLPSERDKLADTEKGLISGISGKSRYGDEVYSIKKKYDTVSKTFINTYYYWVKNPTIIPVKEGRILSADSLSRLISDPKSYGYPCLVLLGSESFSLLNCDSYLKDTDVVLSVQYWTTDVKEGNAHTQWKIISEHPNTIIPYEIEQKWIDSLLGKDKNGRSVPDLRLPIKQRFGIENRPRQSMFVNRIEALKQFIDRVNSILKQNLIVDEFDLTPLSKFEDKPSIISGVWDVSIDTDAEFRFVGTSQLEQIKLSPVIVDGKISEVEIVQRGRGYVNVPPVLITGKGKEAEIKIRLNDTGGVSSVEIINQGTGYKSDTILTVRPFSVLVLSDSDSYDKWSVYQFNKLDKTWSKTRTQSYDVTKYWDYIDWYTSGYDQFTKLDHIVSNTYELSVLEANIGSIVKVKNVGSGGWLLLLKINDLITIDYTQNFKVIGRQNGTIKFLDTLYNFKKKSLGFDGPLYDSDQYDTVPTTELAIILDTIKNKLLVDNLRVEYLKLFFAGVRYALYEQPFLDWIFKTSFVKATHNAGLLRQKTNYNSDNLPDYESYVNEVKPYRTKIREYISSYTRIENAALSVTDFDLPPIIDDNLKINPLTAQLNDYKAIGSSYTQLLDYPWRHWYDNASYTIESIELVDGGNSYIEPPVVSIVDDYGIVTSTNELKSNFDGSHSFWVLSEGTMKIVATGLPYHSYGIQDAENVASDQSYNQILPLRGGTYAAGAHADIPLGIIGYWLNGVAVYNPSAGDQAPEGYDSIVDYNYNAAYGSARSLEYNFKHDVAGGLVDYDSVYSYRDYSFRDSWLSGIGNDLADVAKIETTEIPYFQNNLEHSDGHSKILGFALDGYPIYGPNGYSVATDPTSGITRMTSSYDLKPRSYRTGLVSDVDTYPMGIFIQDYQYTGNGTLDKHNGRYCITPDYPNGTYAYFVTTTNAGTPVYPYIIGPTFFGDPAPQDRNDATNGKGTPPRTYNLYNSTAVRATAKAFITNGKVTRLVLTNSGSGYLTAPRVIFEGGLNTDIPHRAARAVAVLKGNVVRSNKIIVKFDRNTRNYFVTELTQVETFVGTGSRKQYSLRFSPVLTLGNTTVKINDNEILRDDYTLSIKKNTNKGFTSYYGILTFETAPASGSTIEITYNKNFDHLNAADRINFYYNPQTGQLGKDLAQLMTGIDYGGVIVSGLGLSLGGGWDSQPWFSEGWDSYDVGFTDYIVTVSDSTYVFELPYLPQVNEQINVYLNGVRIDDEYFDSYDGITVQPNGRKTAPEGRVMQTWTGDGVNKIIELPNLTSAIPLDINTGDKVIFRKSTSDGSINPDPKSFDTQLQGGNLGYTTATGFAPDDILVEGGGRFITPETSHAPEEIVPGHISDTLNIKVFRVPRSGSSAIISKNYICDGVNTEFNIGQFPNNTAGVIVNLDNQILSKDSDYTIDWITKTVILNVAPADKKIINITSLGTATENLLDSNYFIADGSTSDYITNAPWPLLSTDSGFEQSIDRLGSVVLVNNTVVEYELFRTDESYETTGFVGIRFPEPPAQESVINYIMTGDANSTLSLINSQALDVDGSTVSYSLGTIPQDNAKPYENYILVINNGNLLRPAESIYWKLEQNEYVYSISNYKALPFSLDPSTIKVYIDGEQLNILDYTINNVNLTIEIRDYVYVEGGILTLTRFDDTDYTITMNNIIFDSAPTGQVDIITFFNHSVQNIVRTREFFNITSSLVPGSVTYYQYNSIRGGSLRLFRTTQSDDYIWIAKNRQLLVHSVDYYLDDDNRTVKFKDTFLETDVIDVILFGDNNVTNSIGFMQFKDMLNRTHYKRINKNKSTRLTKDLKQRDLTIEVENGAALTDPNRSLNLPGVVEINGERIEYLTKNGNVLGQLRRATLGTGSPAVHKFPSIVLDIGPTETIPYNDDFVVESSIGDGSTKNIRLSYAPTKVDVDWYTDTIPSNFGRSDEIEVFVGGYRLKKNPYSLFDETNQYPDSPEGDNINEAEFSVDGTEQVRLTNEVGENVKITVIKKVGRVWEDSGPAQRTFRNIQVGSGGAVFDVIKNSTQYVLTLRRGGANYAVGNVLQILGTRLGGKTPENDITITITNISDDSSASILGYTYEGNGAETGYTTVSISESNNPVANFLKDTEAVWPQYLVDKYQYVLLTEAGETITVDGNEPLELD